MEIKINREIRDYTETVFFGLTLRQFLFSLGGVGAAAGLFFLLRPCLGTELLSWLCILAAVPFAVFGFVRYNGMPAEKLIAAWIKSEILTPKKLVFRPADPQYEQPEPEKQRRKRSLLKTIRQKGSRKDV